jgi:predicted Fe-Mo cluster-binding NifX family protein
MKIAITTQGNDLNALVDPRLGRCRKFVLIDSESMEYNVIDNSNATASGGAGIQTAQFLASQKVQAVITGNCGPNAFKTLNAAGIPVYVGADGSVNDALDAYKDGKLEQTAQANVGGHFGDSR